MTTQEAAVATAPVRDLAVTRKKPFMSWTEFCNKVAVEIVLTREGTQMLSGFTTSEVQDNPGKVASPFFGHMEKAYMAVRAAYEIGLKKFGE